MIAVFAAGHGEIEGQDAGGIEAGRHVLEAGEAADEQAGADEQDHRERQFGDHEQAADVVAASPDRARAGGAAGRVLEGGVEIQPGNAEGRDKAEENAGEDGQ